MKTKLFLCFAIVLMAVASTSCKRATYLKADKQQLMFTREGGSQTVSLSSDVKEFKVTAAPDWVEPTIVGSKLVVTARANDANAQRRSSIIVEVPGKKLEIPVNQVFKATYLRVYPTSLTFNRKGGTQIVKVECDGVVQVDAPSDVTATFDGVRLTVVSPANNGERKTESITLTADDQTAKIYVVRKGSVCPTCGGSGSIRCKMCDGDGWYYDDWGNEVPCYTCGGYYDYYGETWYAGSGRVTCPTCGGTGRLR